MTWRMPKPASITTAEDLIVAIIAQLVYQSWDIQVYRLASTCSKNCLAHLPGSFKSLETLFLLYIIELLALLNTFLNDFTSEVRHAAGFPFGNLRQEAVLFRFKEQVSSYLCHNLTPEGIITCPCACVKQSMYLFYFAE